MNMKQIIITIMFALITLEGLAQTKTATIMGYSPALTKQLRQSTSAW